MPCSLQDGLAGTKIMRRSGGGCHGTGSRKEKEEKAAQVL